LNFNACDWLCRQVELFQIEISDGSPVPIHGIVEAKNESAAGKDPCIQAVIASLIKLESPLNCTWYWA
jgi:hypothetical protein